MVNFTQLTIAAAALYLTAAMPVPVAEPQNARATINGHQAAINNYRAQLAGAAVTEPQGSRPVPTNNAQRVVQNMMDRDFQTDKAIAYMGAHSGPVGHAVADILLSPPVQAASTGIQYAIGSAIGGAEDRRMQRLAAGRQNHKRDAMPEPQNARATINGHQAAINNYRAQLAGAAVTEPQGSRPVPTNNAQRVVQNMMDRDFQTDKAIAYMGAHSGPVGHAVADILLSPPVQAASTGIQYAVGSAIGGAEDRMQRFAAVRQH